MGNLSDFEDVMSCEAIVHTFRTEDYFLSTRISGFPTIGCLEIIECPFLQVDTDNLMVVTGVAKQCALINPYAHKSSFDERLIK